MEIVSSSSCDQTFTLYIRTIKEGCSMTQRQAAWGQPLYLQIKTDFRLCFYRCVWVSKHRTPFVAHITNHFCSIEIGKIIQEHNSLCSSATSAYCSNSKQLNVLRKGGGLQIFEMMCYKMLKHVIKIKPMKSGKYLIDPTITILTQMMPSETHGLQMKVMIILNRKKKLI